MKKFVKTLLIVSILLIVVGAGCIIGGIVSGITTGEVKSLLERYLPFAYVIEEYETTVENEVIELPGEDDSFLVDPGQEEGEELLEMKEADYTFQTEEVRSIDLELGRTDCVIYRAETEEKVGVKVSDSNLTSVRFKNGKLKIESVNKVLGNKTEVLELYLPASLQLEEMEIQVGAGEVQVKGPIQAEEISLEAGAAVIHGDGRVTGKELSMECGAGSIEMTNVDARKIEVESGVGLTRLGLAGSKNQYNVRIESAMGNVTYGDEKFSGLTETYENHPKDADRKIEIESALGEIAISFQE